jgi:hypothetical protein
MGPPTRILTHFNFDGVAINEATGKTAQLQENLIVDSDLESGERTWSGIRIKATMPGGGALILDVGRVIFDASGEVIFEAGQHQLLHEDFEDFCTAMAWRPCFTAGRVISTSRVRSCAATHMLNCKTWPRSFPRMSRSERAGIC